MSALGKMAGTLAGYAPWSAHTTGAPLVQASKTQRMLDFIKANRSANAAELAIEAELHKTGLVNALLKSAINKGQVDLIDGRYCLNTSYNASLQTSLLDAAQLLRRHGWQVKAPA